MLTRESTAAEQHERDIQLIVEIAMFYGYKIEAAKTVTQTMYRLMDTIQDEEGR